jgi:hypothetical protein
MFLDDERESSGEIYKFEYLSTVVAQDKGDLVYAGYFPE